MACIVEVASTTYLVPRESLELKAKPTTSFSGKFGTFALMDKGQRCERSPAEGLGLEFKTTAEDPLPIAALVARACNAF